MSRIDLSKWIESDGGPLILMEKSLSNLWGGHSLTGRVLRITDYDRACQIEDYLGLLDVGDSKALVLNDEPLSTAYWKINSENVIFVRWVYAKEESDISDFLTQAPPIDSWIDTGIKIVFSTEDLVLFDSAYRTNEVEDVLFFQLSKGEYTAKNLLFKPNNEVSLILHSLSAL